MKIYSYSPITGEYLRSLDARKSPLDDSFLIPAHTTIHSPPDFDENEVAVFGGDTWILKPDYRNKIYYDTVTRACYEITEIGVKPDATWTDKDPVAYSSWNGNEWEVDLSIWLDTVVRAQRDEKLLACDYTMMPDYPIDQNKRGEWETYRMQLRDLPATLTAVTDSIPWPPAPD